MKRTSFVSVAAVSVAACIGASSASAQPFDFRAHVATRAATAVGAVQACAVQWNAPTPPPARLHIEAFIGPRGLGVRLTEGEGLRVWRNCATTLQPGGAWPVIHVPPPRRDKPCCGR